MQAAQAHGLSKCYDGGRRAVDGVSFALEEGEVFGFLGPNGAGKTTTVKLLTGMLSPTEGTCSVFGVDPAKEPEKVHADSGVVTEHAQMYDNLSGQENLLFYGKMFGLDAAKSARRAKELLGQLELSDAADKKLAAYSTGMRQRLSLARALMHSPKMLFLDEPTSGLDPESARSVNQMIRSLSTERGVTVFLCTHQLRYAQEICTCYGLIDEGKLLASGDLAALRSLVSPGLAVAIRARDLPQDIALEAGEDGYFHAQVREEEEIPALVRRIVQGGGSIYHVLTSRPSLEEIYFALIKRRKEEEA